MERVMRFELTTATLATWCSTPELHPHAVERVMRFELTTATLATWCSTPELHPQKAPPG